MKDGVRILSYGIGFNQTTRLFSDDELACNPCKRGDAVLCLFEYYQS